MKNLKMTAFGLHKIAAMKEAVFMSVFPMSKHNTMPDCPFEKMKVYPFAITHRLGVMFHLREFFPQISS